MKHVSNDVSNELSRIGNVLGVEKEDIFNLKRQVSNNETMNHKMLLMHDPVDCYKDPVGGYYGTISINDFQ